MGNLNKTLVYHLVDTLGITAEIDTSKDAISGEGSFEIALGKLKVPFPLKITGSRGGTRELLVTAKCVGNLGLLLHVTPEGQFGRITLHLLNLAKTGPIDSWLKDKAPASHDKAVELLGKAVVKSFRKTTKKDWYAI